MIAARTIVILATMQALFAGAAAAQTSSWSSAADPSIPKPTTPVARPKASKPQPHAADPLSRFQKRQVGAPAPRPEPPPTAEDAAMLAFEKGEYLTALTLAGTRAEQGDAAAHTLIGRIYDEGLGVNKDPGAAARWYARGAELGDVEAAFALGVMKAEGRGVERDYNGAAEMFERRHAPSMPSPATISRCCSGGGQARKSIRAAQHLAFAARGSRRSTTCDISAGARVKPDAFEASRWLRRAPISACRGQPTVQCAARSRDQCRHAARYRLSGQPRTRSPPVPRRLARVCRRRSGRAQPGRAAKWRLIARDGKLPTRHRCRRRQTSRADHRGARGRGLGATRRR
jgi:hypothetical protein